MAEQIDFFFTSSCNDCNDSSPDDLKHEMVIIRGSVGALSFFTCAFAIGLFFWDLRLLSRFTYRLAMYLVIAAMFYSIVAVFAFEGLAYNPSSADDVRFCIAAGFLLQYSDWIKLLLTTIATFHLFLLMVLHWNLQQKIGIKLEIGCIVFSLIIPLSFIWYPFVNHTYGQAGAWCWIKTKDENGTSIEVGKVEQLAHYGPFLILLLFNTIVIVVIIFVLVSRSAHGCYKQFHPNDPARESLLKFSSDGYSNTAETGNTTKDAQLLKISLPLLAYPIVYQILCFFAFSDRLYRIVDNKPLFILWIAHAFASASRGFFSGVTLIIHLCLVKSKRKRNIHSSPRQQLAAEPQQENGNHNSINSEEKGAAGNRANLVSYTVNPGMSLTVNTTQYPIPRESEVDRAVLQAATHCKNVLTEEERLEHQETKSTVSDGATPASYMEVPTEGEKRLEMSDNPLTPAMYATSDAGITSDEEHATKYRPPQESAVDNALLLGNKTPILLVRGTPATDTSNGSENQGKQGSLQQLKNIEKMLDEEGCGTSDTAVTSDEEIITHKVPQESTVDKAILKKEGVISCT